MHFLRIRFIVHYYTIYSGHKIIYIHTNNIMSDTQLLFESPIIRQPTFHQTSLSLSIYIYYIYFFLLPYFHYNISQSLHIGTFHIYTEYSLRGSIHIHVILSLYTISLHSRFFKYVHRPPKSIISLSLSSYSPLYVLYKSYCVILY